MNPSQNNLPERVGGNTLAETASGGVLRVLDGAVYLPEGETIAADSKEFDLMLRENLPPGIAVDVAAQWRGASRRTTRLQCLGTVLALLAAGLLL